MMKYRQPCRGRVSPPCRWWFRLRELDLGTEPMLRIAVFMNVFDCHVNRSPARGRVSQIVYRPGQFVNAELDKPVSK